MSEQLDMSAPIRTALIQAAGIGDELGVYQDEPAVFTRRPVPDEATAFPQIIVNPDASLTDEDGLTSERPVCLRDIGIYGRKGRPGSADDQTRLVEALGFRTRALFHRQRFSIVPDGYSVVDIRAGGPVPAPVDDDATVGRLVSLTIRLRRNP